MANDDLELTVEDTFHHMFLGLKDAIKTIEKEVFAHISKLADTNYNE
jgi:hypothetical protein